MRCICSCLPVSYPPLYILHLCETPERGAPLADRPKKKRWTTTALPTELIEEIRAHIGHDARQEYTSVLEFVRDAVREKLDQVSPNRRAAKLVERLDRLGP